MTNFNLGALTDWDPICTGEVMSFDVLPGSTRAVEFDFIASEDLVCAVATSIGAMTIPLSGGYHSIRFVTDESVGVSFLGDPDAVAFVRTRFKTQLLADDGSVSYTSIEPRQAHPSDEMARMMNLMKLNQARRDRELMEQFQRREDELIERIERTRAPNLEERQAERAQQEAAEREAAAEAASEATSDKKAKAKGEPTDDK